MKKPTLRSNRRVKLLLLCMITFLKAVEVRSQMVDSWKTTGNQSALLQSQATIHFTPTGNSSTINVTDATTYQFIDGFGYCLTEGSAEVINSLDATQQTNLLNELFSASGIGVSVLRISIGASDLSSSAYSYNDVGPDTSLANFSLAGPDLTYLIPLIKKILLINPNIKILATPWSAPRWMKTNNAWIGGSLNTIYYNSYANYFVKYITAMQAEGINIWAITPQNEPENPKNEPSMVMTATEQTNFINNNLGPALQRARLTPKIIAFDHNCNNTAYPIEVCNNSTFVDGAAFHLYAGSISAMSTVRSSTGKNVYFTEQYTGSEGSFSADLGWHMTNVMIGSTTNWAKIALEWNLATNSSYGPRTQDGCTTCLGAITVTTSSSYTKNVSYYIVAHLSKFIKPGAQRIQSSSSNGNLSNVAFKNPDGSIGLLVYNSGPTSNFTVGFGSNAFSYTLNGNSVVTFLWN